jgi:hypothetical protein
MASRTIVAVRSNVMPQPTILKSLRALQQNAPAISRAGLCKDFAGLKQWAKLGPHNTFDRLGQVITLILQLSPDGGLVVTRSGQTHELFYHVGAEFATGRQPL